MENKINKEIKIFENEEFGQIRTILINNEPWFVGKDIASILGYSKPRNAIATHVDEDDALKQGVIDELGRNQQTTMINESGLYSLILSSKLPTAKKFKRWVTSEVLPTIRKTGGYIPVKEEDTEMEILSKALLIANKTMEMQKERLKNLEVEKNKAIEDKNKLIHTSKTYTASELAKELGFRSAKALNETLRDMNIIYKCNGTWIPKANYAQKGYMETKQKELDNGIIKYYSKWTGTGRDFLLDLFKDE